MESFDITTVAFKHLRDDFNAVLARTINSMMEKDSKESTLTVKLNISLEHEAIVDENAPDGVREIIKPLFFHKVSSAMNIKTEEQGQADQQYELVWDEMLQEFGMRRIEAKQLTF